LTALNLDKLYAKFRDIEESVARLREFGKIPQEQFLADRDNLDIASFRLIVATAAAIDTCLHICAKLLKLVPADYAACFYLLAEHGLIHDDLATRLAQMARFRNVLIHRYWHLDYQRVYEIITGADLDDLLAFMKHIAGLIDE
jgi:uncharacterized protein YutE (UPF0331/DUF86 family)